LGLSFKETGRLTLRTFFKLYEHYKNDYDLEFTLKRKNLTYAEAQAQADKNEEWF